MPANKQQPIDDLGLEPVSADEDLGLEPMQASSAVHPGLWGSLKNAFLPNPASMPYKLAEGEIPSDPLSFEGNPSNIGEWANEPGNIVAGVKDIAHGDVARGGHEVLSSAGRMMMPAAPFAAAASPAAFATSALTGTVGSHLAGKGAEAFGATPDQTDFIGDLGGIVSGGAGAKLPQAGRAALQLGRNAMPRVLPAVGKTSRVLSDIVDPDLTGVFSPRLAHVQRGLGRMADAIEAGAKVKPVLPEQPSKPFEYVDPWMPRKSVEPAPQPPRPSSQGFADTREDLGIMEAMRADMGAQERAGLATESRQFADRNSMDSPKWMRNQEAKNELAMQAAERKAKAPVKYTKTVTPKARLSVVDKAAGDDLTPLLQESIRRAKAANRNR